MDEELTLRLGDFSFRHIFHIVSTQRGGGPLHFWLEHFLLGWWPGLPALRVPSLVFLCLALPAVALIVRRLLDDDGAAGAVVLLTAASPIPVLYATFGRPHTMLFAWLMWSTVVALKAAVDGSRRLWIVAGALLGLSVFIHPTAPLYALTAFAAALVFAPRPPRAVAREAWPGVVALLVTFVPYYVRTLHVLSDRYGVGSGQAQGRTFSGRPVWEDALHFVAPGRHDLNYFTVLALIGVVALLVRRAHRTLAFCALTVAAPVVFFSFVPASGDSALFFDRYMIPVTPAFLTVVLAGCLAIARWAGRWSFVVLVLLVAGLLAVEIRYDVHHRDAVHRIGVDAVTQAVAREPKGSVLFGSTGTCGRAVLVVRLRASGEHPRPPRRAPRVLGSARRRRLVRARGAVPARPVGPRFGVWLFYAASRGEATAGTRALGVAPVGGHYFVVRSARPESPRALIREGLLLRERWKRAVPFNQRVDELLTSDRQLLAGTCVPYGELGDPDISPHWPPVVTSHQ